MEKPTAVDFYSQNGEKGFGAGGREFFVAPRRGGETDRAFFTKLRNGFTQAVAISDATVNQEVLNDLSGLGAKIEELLRREDKQLFYFSVPVYGLRDLRNTVCDERKMLFDDRFFAALEERGLQTKFNTLALRADIFETGRAVGGIIDVRRPFWMTFIYASPHSGDAGFVPRWHVHGYEGFNKAIAVRALSEEGTWFAYGDGTRKTGEDRYEVTRYGKCRTGIAAFRKHEGSEVVHAVPSVSKGRWAYNIGGYSLC